MRARRKHTAPHASLEILERRRASLYQPAPSSYPPTTLLVRWNDAVGTVSPFPLPEFKLFRGIEYKSTHLYKWNDAVGMVTPMQAITNRLALVLLARALNDCCE